MEKHQLDWISIEGFKSIANSGKIKLRPINLVIGANGSGKSNFIETFGLLQALRFGQLQNYVTQAGFANSILHFGVKKTSCITLKLSLGDEQDSYEVELRPQQNRGLTPHREIAMYWNKQSHQPLITPLFAVGGVEAGISSSSLGGVKGRIPKQLDSLGIFHVHDTSRTSPLRAPNKTNDNHFLKLRQSPDVSNLAAYLHRLKATHPNDYSLIVKTIRLAAPFFDDFLLIPEVMNPDYIGLQWLHKGSSEPFYDSSLSDGTLRFIALTTLLMQPLELRPSIILIDEPELGLHPAAITLLAAMIQSASVNTQIIAATQSPILLDYFEPEDVLVAERDNGSTIFNRLEPEALRVWLEDYSLGQLWEKNYLGGRPLNEKIIH